MSYSVNHKKNEQNDRLKSAAITTAVALLILLGLYFYKFTRLIPESQQIVTTMLINFGDDQNGNGPEEPANEEQSAALGEEVLNEQPKPAEELKPIIKEKLITGNDKKTAAPKVEKVEKKVEKPVTTNKSTTKPPATTRATAKTSATGKAQGDSKATAAIGSLIRGRGTAAGSQGTGGTAGNAGDPLGGQGNGDSRIGVDRKLVSFIPGTMGRGGAQPSHNCTASGTITVSYTVDKAGNVVSARRSGGVSDPCVVSTSVSWVKKYVKAEKANVSSTGTYRITF